MVCSNAVDDAACSSRAPYPGTYLQKVVADSCESESTESKIAKPTAPALRVCEVKLSSDPIQKAEKCVKRTTRVEESRYSAVNRHADWTKSKSEPVPSTDHSIVFRLANCPVTPSHTSTPNPPQAKTLMTTQNTPTSKSSNHSFEACSATTKRRLDKNNLGRSLLGMDVDKTLEGFKLIFVRVRASGTGILPGNEEGVQRNAVEIGRAHV